MSMVDLISVRSLRSWLNIPRAESDRDAELERLIRRISRATMNYLNRSTIAPSVLSETMSGTGSSQVILRNWPVMRIDQICTIGESGGDVTLPGDLLSQPYMFNGPDTGMFTVSLRNRTITRGSGNLLVQYMAGYATSESATVDSSLSVRVSPMWGSWLSHIRVLDASGAPMVKVSSPPADGEFSLTDGVYTFSSGMSGQTVTVECGYVPSDIEQCVLEWCAYRYSTKDRIGQTSKSIGGQESVSYTNEAVPEFVAAALQNYRRVVPC